MEATRRRPVWAVCAAVVVAAAVLSLLWTDTASTQPIFAQGWRCYPAKQPKGETKFAPVDLIFNGTLQGTSGPAPKPVLSCHPLNQGLNNTTFPGLVCYSIKDDSKFSGETVEVSSSALFTGMLAVKKSKTFCTLGFGHPVPVP